MTEDKIKLEQAIGEVKAVIKFDTKEDSLTPYGKALQTLLSFAESALSKDKCPVCRGTKKNAWDEPCSCGTGTRQQGLSIDEVMLLVRDNTLQRILENKDNQVLVFKCCGRIGKPIETTGLCPHCNKENTEVVNKWKYDLAHALWQAGQTGGVDGYC